MTITRADASPQITPSTATLGKFYAQQANPSNSRVISFQGANLTNNIEINTSTTDFELSTNNTTFSAGPITLIPVGGTVAPTNIFVRLRNGLALNGNYTANLTATSTGAPTQTIALRGGVYGPINGFDANNLVMAVIGDDSEAITNDATPVFLAEYTPTGVLVDLGMLPIVDNGANRPFTVVGTSPTSAMVNLSPDRKFLFLAGSAAPAGSDVATTNSADKVIARVDFNGNVNTTTTITDAYSGFTLRSATSVDGQRIFVAGQGPNDASSGGGLRVVNFGSTGASSPVVSPSMSGADAGLYNMRYVQIARSNLYVSSGAGTSNIGINRVDNGLAGTPSNLTRIVNLNNIQTYIFVDIDGVPGEDLLYISRDGTNAAEQGVDKYAFDGTNWVARGAIRGAQIRGLFAEEASNGTSVNLVFTANTTLYSFTDNNALTSSLSVTLPGAATILATSTTNAIFKGIARTPLNVITADVAITSTASTATLSQGAERVQLTSSALTVSTANATLTSVAVPLSGTYQPADIISFQLVASPNATLDPTDEVVSTVTTIPTSGSTLVFGPLARVLTQTTHYLFVVANVGGCGVTSRTLTVGAIAPSAFGFTSANVTGTASTAATSTIATGLPARVTNLQPTLGQNIIPLTWTNADCFTNILVAVSAAGPITGTPTGTYPTANDDFAVAPLVTGLGSTRALYFGTGTSVTLRGLVAGTTYFVNVYTFQGGRYSLARSVQVVPVRQAWYSRASGAVTGAIWSRTPTGTPSTASFTQNDDIVVQTGHTVTYSSQLNVLNVEIQQGGKLSNIGGTNAYIRVFGSQLTVQGTLGNDLNGGVNNTSVDPMSALMEIRGNGRINIGRLRKSTPAAANVTVRVQHPDVEVMWNGDAVYLDNNAGRLDVDILPGAHLRLTGPNGTLRLDGTGNDAGGTVTVAGRLTVNSNLNLTNNNATQATALNILSTGVVRTNNFTFDPAASTAGKSVTIANGGRFEITGTLFVSSGTLAANGIVMVSEDGFQGRINQINTGTITGQVTSQRRITTEGWHLMSAPVQGATFGQLPRVRITPPNNANVFIYTEGDSTSSRLNGQVIEANGWKIPTGLTQLINQGGVVRGMRYYTRNIGGAPLTVSMTGVPYTGTVNMPLTNSGTGYDGGGWNFIGNPYISNINWSAVSARNATNPNFEAVYYVWDPTILPNGGYRANPSVSGYPLAPTTIAAQQAFFIKVNGSMSMSFQESDKATGAATFLRTGTTLPDVLTMTVERDGGVWDRAAIHFSAEGTEGFDRLLDARKMANPTFNLSTLTAGGLRLAFNGLPTLTGTRVVPVRSTGPVGTYRLVFTDRETFAPATRIYVRDLFLGTTTEITDASSEVSFSITSDPGTQGTRFEVVFAPAGVTSTTALTAPALRLSPNPVEGGQQASLSLSGYRGTQVTVEVISVTGQRVATFEQALHEGRLSMPLGDLKAGVYTVRTTSAGQTLTQKLIVR